VLGDLDLKQSRRTNVRRQLGRTLTTAATDTCAPLSLTIYTKAAITSKIKHAIKHAIKLKTSPARLAQLLQPSLAFCFSLQPMMAHRVQVLQDLF